MVNDFGKLSTQFLILGTLPTLWRTGATTVVSGVRWKGVSYHPMLETFATPMGVLIGFQVRPHRGLLETQFHQEQWLIQPQEIA